MSGECCHCCERRELKKQCRIVTFSSDYCNKNVEITHFPTGMFVQGIGVDKTLDMLMDALVILEDKNIDTVAKFKACAKDKGLSIRYV